MRRIIKFKDNTIEERKMIIFDKIYSPVNSVSLIKLVNIMAPMQMDGIRSCN